MVQANGRVSTAMFLVARARQESGVKPSVRGTLSQPPCLTLARAGRNLNGSVGAYRFRRERLRLGGMPGVHTTRNRSGTKTTANTQYAYAA
jgi:hypothetical protein